MPGIFSDFTSGLLFGLGLTLSDMINPERILNFLDLFGTWDPTLGFVMISALATSMLGFKIVLRRDKPLFDAGYRLPTKSDIDHKLVGGAALFGLGWGLGGYCPGPVITGLSLGELETFIFTVSMLAGMGLFSLLKASGPRPLADWLNR